MQRHHRDGDSDGAPPSADAVLMVRPAHFGANAETAGSNFFQRAIAARDDWTERARSEFDSLALALAGAGVRVHQFAGLKRPPLPDEVFPNNWLSLHADGTAVLYPLLAENRRRERRPEFLTALQRQYGYHIARTVDLSPLESRGEFLEGTGSLVLDRERRLAYACLSPRTHRAALAEFARALDYEVLPFTAVDRAGRPIYHTNVLLAVGARFAVLCARAIPNSAERRSVRSRLERSGREVIDIDLDQLEAFAANLLELRGRDGPVIVLSARALASLDTASGQALERHGRLVTADVGTIEDVGGGGVRCMLAEVALPRAVQAADRG